MHVTTRRRQRRWYFEYSWRQLRTMGSAAPVGGDGGAGRGLRVDATAASGGGGGTATEAARGGGGVFARCCSSRGPLFYELAESWRGGASARAGPFYPAEKVYVRRNSYLDHSQDILAKPQNIFLEKKSPRGHLAKSSKIYSHILGIAIFFWLFYCWSRYILAKPHICIYVRGLAKIFWLRKNGYIEWIQHVSTYRGPEYRTSGRARTKTRSRKKNKVVGLKVRCCVGAVFD